MATIATAIPSPRIKRWRSTRTGGRASVTQFHYVKRIHNRSLYREVDRERRWECFGMMALAGVIFCFFLAYAWQHFQCLQYGYQIQELKQQRANLEEKGRQLRLEQALLTNPQRIDTLARQTLGLASPTPSQVLRMGSADTPAPVSPEYARNLSAPAPGSTPASHPGSVTANGTAPSER